MMIYKNITKKITKRTYSKKMYKTEKSNGKFKLSQICDEESNESKDNYEDNNKSNIISSKTNKNNINNITDDETNKYSENNIIENSYEKYSANNVILNQKKIKAIKIIQKVKIKIIYVKDNNRNKII